MSVLIAKNWWSLVSRGVAAMVLGLLVLVRSGVTTGELQLFFGFYAIIDGLIALVGGVRAAEDRERWPSLWIEGVTGFLVGLITFGWPSMSGFALFYIISAWALITGTFEILAARRLRLHVAGEWLLALSGIASVALGVLLIAAPLAGALPVAYWVGVYGLVFGALLAGLGLRLRKWAASFDESGGALPSRA
jgi:uncharacterized membrane protein HdeD (DUF308 family)